MKIGTKIFWSAFVPGTIFIIAGMMIFYNFSTTKLKQEVGNRLDTTAQERVKQLRIFLEHNESTVKLIAEEHTFKEFLLTEKTDPRYYHSFNEVEKRLNDIVITHDVIINSCLINKDGISVASSGGESCVPETQSCAGTDKNNNTIFTEGRKGFYIKNIHRTGKDLNEVVLSMSAPILEDNIFLGVIAIKIKKEKLYDITSEIINFENVGEVYLVNQDNYVITPLKSDESVILNKKINTENTKNCFSAAQFQENNNPNNLEANHIGHNPYSIFKGYDGQDVIGAHVYMPEMKWCLLAEINRQEAFSSTRTLWSLACILVFTIFIFILLFSFCMGRRIAGPIKKLQKDTEFIAKGNLDHKAFNHSKDEIGQLSKSFNEMTERIKKSREEVDKKVKAQTKKIKEHEKALEQSKNTAEKIVKSMVGREEKMMELKKEIKRLKQKK